MHISTIQGMFCGRSPSPGHNADETRALGVKLGLLSQFKHAKLTYFPDTPPANAIIKKVGGGNIILYLQAFIVACAFPELVIANGLQF